MPENEFLKMSDALIESANIAIKETLKVEANKVLESLKRLTPRETSGLVNSLKMSEINESDRVGHKIVFDGYNKDNISYQKIANALNRGFIANFGNKYVEGKHFIDKSVSLLRGVDSRINSRWEIEISKRIKD